VDGFQSITRTRRRGTKKAQRFHARLHVSFFNTGIFSQPVAGLKHFLHLIAKNLSTTISAVCWLSTHHLHATPSHKKSPTFSRWASCFILQYWHIFTACGRPQALFASQRKKSITDHGSRMLAFNPSATSTFSHTKAQRAHARLMFHSAITQH